MFLVHCLYASGARRTKASSRSPGTEVASGQRIALDLVERQLDKRVHPLRDEQAQALHVERTDLPLAQRARGADQPDCVGRRVAPVVVLDLSSDRLLSGSNTVSSTRQCHDDLKNGESNRSEWPSNRLTSRVPSGTTLGRRRDPRAVWATLAAGSNRL
jgi:hypothetical protein